ncbi:MAG: hypothetical protein M3133_04710 [Actinomycetota bacterium]|nr:hypothetical protein [Actinomycetota bacterium]
MTLDGLGGEGQDEHVDDGEQDDRSHSALTSVDGTDGGDDCNEEDQVPGGEGGFHHRRCHYVGWAGR